MEVFRENLSVPINSPPTSVRGASASYAAIIAAALITGLYFGRDVLVPIALAVLLSFVLAPVTVALQRLYLGRVASVLLSVALALVILLGLGAVIGRQVGQLAEKLPQYQVAIGKKLQSLRNSDFGKVVTEKAAEALSGLETNLSTQTAGVALPGASDEHSSKEPLPVEIRQPAPSPVQILQSVVAALLPPLATMAVVVIFVVFILLQRQDLRDRFIKLTGAHDLHRTTKALDDAASRLSRYLLALTGVNAAFGILITLGLTFVGVPNPVLWGIVGGVLRFIPYLGAIIASAFPLALAAAVDPGWSIIAETAALFVILETMMGQVVEPQVFGHTTGMSPLAIIVSAAFWVLIWGPAGLLLSTPLTACLVVLGKHVENLNFIELILGDRPPLSPVQSFYQRILAGDPDEVAFQAEQLLNEMTLIDYYEMVALPALALAQADVARGVLESHVQTRICAAVESIVDDLSDHAVIPQAGDLKDPAVDGTSLPAKSESDAARDDDKLQGVALCFAGRSPLDQAATIMLTQCLTTRNIDTRVEGPSALGSQGLLTIETSDVKATCIVYLDLQSKAAVRYSVRRLRRRLPGVPIAVCLWGCPDLATVADSAQADKVVGSLAAAIEFLEQAIQRPGGGISTSKQIDGDEGRQPPPDSTASNAA